MSSKKIKLLVFLLLGAFLGGLIGYLLIPGPEKGVVKALVAPGEKDPYYAFLSGGKGGDVRVFAVPSMRLIKVIPVFNPSAQASYARKTDGNRALLENSGGFHWGNTLFPVLSKTNGDYDGKLMFVQDEAHGRIGKISLKSFDTEDVVKLPNMKTARALAVDSNTKYLMVGGQLEGVAQNGKGVISFVNPQDLKVKVQLLGSEVAMLDGGRDDQKAFGAVPQLAGKEGGAVAVYNLKAIDDAISNSSNYQKVEGIPTVDADKATEAVTYIPIKGKVTEVSVSPDGKYVVAGGEGTKATVIDTASLQVVAELDIGKDPRFTSFDGNGVAYTAIYGDSKVVKWDVAKAVSSKGSGQNYILESINVNSKPVYLDVGDGRTNKPTGKYLTVYNQGGTERFIDVKRDVQNAQVIDISGKEMKLIMDSPVEPQVTDGVTVLATKLTPLDVFTQGPDATLEGKNKIVRKGKEVHIYMTAKRTEYGLEEFKVKQGDHVYLHVTNIERTKDIIHGLTVTDYNVTMELPPGKTVSADFIADKPGVHWYYCTIFCSALHLEMGGRMIVEP